MPALMALTLALPLCWLLGLIWPVLRPLLYRSLPLLPLPLLVLVWVPAELDLPWLLLGARFGVDALNAPFLLLAGLLWSAAALYARPLLQRDHALRFAGCFLLTWLGNLGVLLALDGLSFYLAFALMTFAAYGLIVHNGDPAARRAGRVYLSLAVLGEGLLLVALFMLAAHLGNPDVRALAAGLAELPERQWLVGLLFLGFAIKMGAVPLHVWLPLAHPAAPVAASAVLSGIIIKAGLVGWLRFLPLGVEGFGGWGHVCIAVGLLTTFYAVVVGLLQRRPKTVLAYSSISQMGLATLMLGIGLARPETLGLLLPALAVFALHHGLAKAALFLGAGLGGQRWVLLLLALPALALAGAPLTGGMLSKALFKDLAQLAPAPWGEWLGLLLALSSVATALLMARFLYLLAQSRASISSVAEVLALLLLIALLPLPLLWYGPAAEPLLWAPALLLDATGPLLLALLLLLVVWGPWRGRGPRIQVPEGDLLALLPDWAGLADRLYHRNPPPAPVARHGILRLVLRIGGDERFLRQWTLAGAVFLLLCGCLFLLLLGRSVDVGELPGSPGARPPPVSAGPDRAGGAAVLVVH